MNIVEIIVAAVAGVLVGFLWYSPIILGNQWMKEVGMTEEKMQKAKEKGMTMTYVLSTLSAIVTAVVLAILFTLANADTFLEGVLIALLVWVGFIVTFGLTAVLYEEKSWKLFGISMGYQLAMLLAMTVMLILL